jgi:hypothetical protein
MVASSAFLVIRHVNSPRICQGRSGRHDWWGRLAEMPAAVIGAQEEGCGRVFGYDPTLPHSATCAYSLNPPRLDNPKRRKSRGFPYGHVPCPINNRRSWQGDWKVKMRTLMNRCGDRELLWALMALVGAIVVAINS